MHNLYVTRHAQSEANKLGVIQGQTVNPPLSKEGEADARNSAPTSLFQNEDIRAFFTSDSLRAQQTTEILNGHGKPVITTPLVREVHSGRISGKHKKWIAENFPDDLAIWHRYGDLDGIPDAETGNQLQARALCFLYNLQRNHPSGNYGLVAHAAFNRSLINTIEGFARTTLQEHGHLQSVKCADVFRKVTFEKIGTTFTSEVFRVPTCEGAYVVKEESGHSEGKLKELGKVIHFLRSNGFRTPEMLFAADCEHPDTKDTYTVSASPYLEGETLEKDSMADSLDATLPYMRNYSFVLKSCDVITADNTVPSLDGMISKLKRNKKLERDLLKFINSDDVNNTFNRAATYGLVDHDCHMGNYIREPNGSITKIDVSLVRAPLIYQAGSYLSAFLLKTDFDGSLVERLAQRWSVPPEQTFDFLTAMKLRICFGINYFSGLDQNTQYNDKAEGIENSYRRAFHRLEAL